MSDKRFKIGDRVKVVSIKRNAPIDTIGLTGEIIRESETKRFEWCVKFENFRETGYADWFLYNECDLEPAEETVKLEIEIPAFPKYKIPVGMKLGSPMAKYQIVKPQPEIQGRIIMATNKNTYSDGLQDGWNNAEETWRRKYSALKGQLTKLRKRFAESIPAEVHNKIVADLRKEISKMQKQIIESAEARELVELLGWAKG